MPAEGKGLEAQPSVQSGCLQEAVWYLGILLVNLGQILFDRKGNRIFQPGNVPLPYLKFQWLRRLFLASVEFTKIQLKFKKGKYQKYN